VDLDGAITHALDVPLGQEPLEKWVKSDDRVILISDDNTRLTPADRLIMPLLERLNAAGVRDDRISCIMALGTHRYMTEAEMEAKAGADVYRRIHVFNHEWRDPDALVDLGVSQPGNPITG
jgi:nickel-dependent lactate racemase